MRNSKTHSKTTKKKLNKCKNIFYAFNDLQLRYGELLDETSDVVDIQCNVKIQCELGDSYTTDFVVTLSNGSKMVRECVFRDKLMKPLTTKMLDASRDFWLSQGIEDWGLVINEC